MFFRMLISSEDHAVQQRCEVFVGMRRFKHHLDDQQLPWMTFKKKQEDRSVAGIKSTKANSYNQFSLWLLADKMFRVTQENYFRHIRENVRMAQIMRTK